MLTITIPFPDPDLFPNRKNGRHWGGTQAIKRKAWDDAYILAIQAVNAYSGEWYPLKGDIPLRLTLNFPDNRHRDLDNTLAACKTQLDAVATALTVNDKQFNPIALHRGKVCKPGSVIIEVGANAHNEEH